VDATKSSLEVVLVDKGVDSVLFDLVRALGVMLDLARSLGLQRLCSRAGRCLRRVLLPRKGVARGRRRWDGEANAGSTGAGGDGEGAAVMAGAFPNGDGVAVSPWPASARRW